MLNIYQEFASQVAAIPVVAGRKSRLESFAGANCTYTIEAMMGDKRALQVCTAAAKIRRWCRSNRGHHLAIICYCFCGESCR